MNKFTKKLIAFVLVMSFVLTAFAGTLTFAAQAAYDEVFFAQLDAIGKVAGEAEKKAVDAGLEGDAVIEAVKAALLATDLVDPDSFEYLEDDEGFTHKSAMGAHCAYNYRINMAEYGRTEEDYFNETEVIDYSVKGKGEEGKGNGDKNVVLVGPFYGYQSDFLDSFYKPKSKAIADYTGGMYTLLSGKHAAASSIAEAARDAAVVIFDSHGMYSSGRSYLCLTSSVGITSAHYSSGNAIYLSSYSPARYLVDGTLLVELAGGTFPGTIFWMGICNGMRTTTLCNPFINNGASVVFGYSLPVSFLGERNYCDTFFTSMMNGNTVATAASAMKSAHGTYDSRYMNAYPIFRSAQDAYPSNINTTQTVKSTKTLPKASTGSYSSSTYKYEKTTTLTNGENYLIGYTSGSTTYLLSSTSDGTYSDTFPYFAAATAKTSSDGYTQFTLSNGTTYGNDLADFELTVGGSASARTFYNDTLNKYLVLSNDSGTTGYPMFRASGYTTWTVSSTGVMKNNSYTGTKNYLGVTDTYLDNVASGSGKAFSFYKRVTSTTPTAAPTTSAPKDFTIAEIASAAKTALSNYTTGTPFYKNGITIDGKTVAQQNYYLLAAQAIQDIYNGKTSASYASSDYNY
ncbi:MAG: hypothetical protein IJF80_07170, partial [Clostridia bacterium]|nr:hypothetical protein [Clostridia bacterium]